jgi:hypothetical protein
VSADRREQAPEAEPRDAEDPGRQAGVARILAAVEVPGVQAAEERRRVRPRVVAHIVVDVLEAGERDRAARGVTHMEAVVHVTVARPARVDEQVEPPGLDGQAAAEAVALDPAVARRLVVGVGDEGVDVVDRHAEVDRAPARDLAPADPALVPVVGTEVDEAGERLGVGDRGHAATMPAAIRSAIAAIVRLGFAPTGPGMIDPSAT